MPTSTSAAPQPGTKPCFGSFPRLLESLFLTPRRKSLFSKRCEDFFHSSIQLAGSWDQKGAHTARGAAGGVEGG